MPNRRTFFALIGSLAASVLVPWRAARASGMPRLISKQDEIRLDANGDPVRYIYVSYDLRGTGTSNIKSRHWPEMPKFRDGELLMESSTCLTINPFTMEWWCRTRYLPKENALLRKPGKEAWLARYSVPIDPL